MHRRPGQQVFGGRYAPVAMLLVEVGLATKFAAVGKAVPAHGEKSLALDSPVSIGGAKWASGGPWP